MSSLELIDKLCEITTELVYIVHKQQQIIEQYDDKELEEKVKRAHLKLDVLEFEMRG